MDLEDPAERGGIRSALTQCPLGPDEELLEVVAGVVLTREGGGGGSRH